MQAIFTSFGILLILSGLSCSQVESKTNSIPNSTDEHVIGSFMSDAREDASKYISQTVQIVLRNAEQPTSLYRTSAFIIDDHTLITSAHTFGAFHVKVTDFAWKPAFELLEISILDAWGKEIFRTVTNFHSFLNGMNPSISVFSAVDPFKLMNHLTIDYIHHDFALVKLHDNSFSNLTGGPIATIKPEIKFPEPNTKFYTLGYSQPSGNLKLHATVFDVDSEFSILNSKQVNVFMRFSGKYPGLIYNSHGDSGGPLIWIDQNKKPHFVGIVTAGIVTERYIENYFTSFADAKIINLFYNHNIATIPDYRCNSATK